MAFRGLVRIVGVLLGAALFVVVEARREWCSMPSSPVHRPKHQNLHTPPTQTPGA